jgi:hypothetical protein
MDFKVSVKAEKSEAFIRLLQSLQDMEAIDKFQIVHAFDTAIVSETVESHQQWSDELTTDLETTEFINRYRDLVD